MKVVILAGGRETRLSEETLSIPKPMVEIGNKPVIWHIMKIYSHFDTLELLLFSLPADSALWISKIQERSVLFLKNLKAMVPGLTAAFLFLSLKFLIISAGTAQFWNLIH